MNGGRLRYGMVGGGPGAFIGDVHRMAVTLDASADLVAGAFSSDRDRSRAHGGQLGLHPGRVYGSYAEMAEREASLPRGERIAFVTIVTPNHLHYDAARTFLEAGFHVVCDKPLTNSVEDAEALCRLAATTERVFAVTYNYSGYPMVKEACSWVAGGRLGDLRKVVVEYSQDWLAQPLEESGQKQAEWRTDPGRAGVAGALGDIGSHAHHLARYVTGLELEAICAELTTYVPGRRLDDDASLLLRWEDGVRGTLCCSQIAVGDENELSLRVYGTEASLVWRHGSPDTLEVRFADRPAQIHRRGQAYVGREAAGGARLPPGHPEGFIEAFANIYRAASGAIRADAEGRPPSEDELDFPTVQDGAHGVHFLHRAVESARAGRWVDASYVPPGAPSVTPARPPIDL